MRAWRIVYHKMVGEAFTGRTAAQVGGRWNPPGHAALYCATSKLQGVQQLLAMWEAELSAFRAIPIDIPLDVGIAVVRRRELPADWRSSFALSREIGGRWLAECETVALEVPSSFTEGDTSLVLNPQHQAFRSLEIGAPEAIDGDKSLGLPARPPTLEQRLFFLCHAEEDKISVVEPLAAELDAAGITYWYDRHDLRLGDSISDKIQQGLANSKYLLAVVSESFSAKGWARKELNSALQREVRSGQTVVIPLLIGGAEERRRIVTALPLLADKLQLRWDGSPRNVVAALLERLLS